MQPGRGLLLVGDERGQRVEGLKADVRHALGPASRRVLRRDLVRDMLRHKGVNPKRLVSLWEAALTYAVLSASWRNYVTVPKDYDKTT